ncbi:sulfite exporter TauE/SafE family protein [Glycocaulis profundi]|nr:sulfite exporter TauE/SafE family protein [Glycocaulis profundi]
MHENPVVAFLLLLVAALYASAGQAGATGYLAVLGFTGLDPVVMRSSALALNVLVAAIGTVQFWRAGLLSWRALAPFLILGVPMSFAGGMVQLPAWAYFPAVGAILLLAAGRMAMLTAGRGGPGETAPPDAPGRAAAMASGGVIGFVSGLTGAGGGIFLAPLLMSNRWAGVRQAAAMAAAFNLVNSAAAFTGTLTSQPVVPSALPLWLAAVAIGGAAGSTLGARFLPERVLQGVLACLLAVAGVQLLLRAFG